MKPIIKREAVDKKKWITEKQFKELVITTNLIPGPSVIECVTFIAILRLGKIKGTIVAFIAVLPHLLLTLLVFILVEKYLDPKYMFAINAGVMPAIIGILIGFAVSHIKSSKKELKLSKLIFLTVVTILFNILIPAPFNIPAIIIVAVILVVFFTTWYVEKYNLKMAKKSQNQTKQKNQSGKNHK